MSEILKLQPSEAFQKIQDGAVFLDIIDEDGFSVIAYDGIQSTQVTLLQLLEKIQWLNKSTTYIAGGYNDASGYKAANLLFHQGFMNVGYVAGGIKAWFQDGFQVKYNVSGGCGTGSCSASSYNTGFDDEGSMGGCSGCSCGH